jgi:hypothetical protein
MNKPPKAAFNFTRKHSQDAPCDRPKYDVSLPFSATNPVHEGVS